MRSIIYTFHVCLFCFLSTYIAKAGDSAAKVVVIRPTSGKIIIDGRLNENTWKALRPLTDFSNQFPKDSGLASLQTEVYISYDDSNLYIGAKCFLDSAPVLPSMIRDFDRTTNESFYVIIDPGDQKIAGYLFGVNTAGVQVDGIVSPDALTTEWDLKWTSAVQVSPADYTIEMAIPLKTLRLGHDISRMGINFARRDLHSKSYSAWSPVPATVNSYDLNYTGLLQWPQVLKKK